VTPEVRELYDALIKPTTIYCDAKAEYEKLRARIILGRGYDGFRDLQRAAFIEICKVPELAEARAGRSRNNQ
jgi:hypothetical protein